MVFNPEIHHRRSIRLKGYDYSQDGAYMVTVCLKNRENLLGSVVNKKMIENPAGEMVRKIWFEIPDHYTVFIIDHFVVMPNHFHGIIIKENVGGGPCASPDSPIDDSGAIIESPVRIESVTGSRPLYIRLLN